MTPEEFESATRLVLDEVTTITLATCEAGLPWATDVYFAADGYELIFFSSPNSRHCRNLANNPACAATVHPTVKSWQDIKGLQMEGSAEPVARVGGKARGLAAYLRKFPFAGELVTNPMEKARAFNKAAMYVFLPTRIIYVDNSLGFGTRYCVRLMEGKMEGSPKRLKNA